MIIYLQKTKIPGSRQTIVSVDKVEILGAR